MATKKYLSYDGLAEYDALIKAEITEGEESAKTYADNAANTVKNDLLNGAGKAYDTLKELADLITENVDAIDALETVAAGKADADHGHGISDVDGLQDALDKKAVSGHNHYAAAITQGTLSTERLPTIPIAKGGTGATTAENARTKLDVYSKSEIEDLLNNNPSILVVSMNSDTEELSHSFEEVLSAFESGQMVFLSIYNGAVILSPVYISEDKSYISFSNLEVEVDEDQFAYAWINGCRIFNDDHIEIDFADLLTRRHPEIEHIDKDIIVALNYALNEKADKADILLKTEQTLTSDELDQVRKNLKFIGKDVEGQTFNINGEDIVAAANAEIFGDYINNKCTGQWSIVEGSTNIATGRVCHVEGANNQALNDGCHVEGVQCIASGYWSHAEGERTRVTSYASHAEGSYTKMPDGTTRYGTASGYASHIEGGGSHASGSCSHAEGLATTAKGNYSHSEGRYTIAGSNNQHVEGCANIEDTASTYIHIAGNGEFGAPSNAHTLDWDGNAWFSGDVYVGSTSGTNRDDGSKKLATEEYVDNKEYDFFILKSSTPGSNKKFKITIDDDGILSSEEVIE